MNNVEFGRKAREQYNINLDQKTCYFCNQEDKAYLDIHHIIPKRYGGSNDKENLLIICRKCHRRLEKVYSDNFYRNLGIHDENGKNKKHFSVVCFSNNKQLSKLKKELNCKLKQSNVSSYKLTQDKSEKSLRLDIHRDLFPDSFRNRNFDERLKENYKIFTKFILSKFFIDYSIIETRIDFEIKKNLRSIDLELKDKKGSLKNKFARSVQYYEYSIPKYGIKDFEKALNNCKFKDKDYLDDLSDKKIFISKYILPMEDRKEAILGSLSIYNDYMIEPNNSKNQKRDDKTGRTEI